MIRNYLGFPRGITGRQLGRRAVVQAAALGASFDLARGVTGLQPGTPHRLMLDDGAVAASHAVVLACGVTYRRLGVATLEALVGHGVFYGASIAQRQGSARRRGRRRRRRQLRRPSRRAPRPIRRTSDARRPWHVARGHDVGVPRQGGRGELSHRCADADRHRRRRRRRTSRVARTARSPTDATGQSTGTSARVRTDGLFILIGSETRTDWLPPDVQRDDQGFVVTGDAVDPPGRSNARRTRSRPAFPACSLPATSAPTTSSASPPPLARVPSPCRWCTRTFRP